MVSMIILCHLDHTCPHYAPMTGTFFQFLKIAKFLPASRSLPRLFLLVGALGAPMLPTPIHTHSGLICLTGDGIKNSPEPNHPGWNDKTKFLKEEQEKNFKIELKKPRQHSYFLLEWRSSPICEEVNIRHSWKQILTSKKIHLNSCLGIYLYYVVLNSGTLRLAKWIKTMGSVSIFFLTLKMM